MIMNAHIAVIGALCVSLAVAVAPPKPGCTLDGCSGPLKFYKDIGCEPIYKNPEDCCPLKYNCDHLTTRSNDKCYAFGHEYNLSEKIRKEDLGCLNECTCVEGREGGAEFICSIASMVYQQVSPGCYRPQNATMCYPGPEICPEKPEDIAKCEVDGETLHDGKYFQPKTEPRKSCYCGPGYKGENVMPFCKDWALENCRPELWHKSELKNRCAPVYSTTQDPALDCNYEWRCEQNGDEVVPREKMLSPGEFITPDPESMGMMCYVGNLTMRFGDELNKVASETKECTKCKCDVPPVPTCANMPMAACTMSAADLVDSDEKKT